MLKEKKKILINNDTKLKFLYNKLDNCNTETVNIKYKDKILLIVIIIVQIVMMDNK